MSVHGGFGLLGLSAKTDTRADVELGLRCPEDVSVEISGSDTKIEYSGGKIEKRWYITKTSAMIALLQSLYLGLFTYNVR